MPKKDPTIRTYYQPEGQEKDMLQRVYKRKFQMESAEERKKAEREWERGRKQWESLRSDRDPEDWQSNHVVPLTTSVVETVLSEVIDQSPRPLILPRGSEDVPKATVMSDVFDYTWQISDSDLEFEDIVHDAFIEGTGIGQEYFYSDIRKIKTGKENGKWNEKDMIDYNDCYLECIKNNDFFVDETARGFRGPYGARDAIRRYIMNIDDFKQFFKGDTWDPLGNADKVTPGGNVDYYEWYKPPEGIDKSTQVEVLWYWAVKPDDWLCIVANDVMIVMGPNPYRHKQLPFVRAIDIKRTHKFYGKGEAALLESIQDELNVLRRMVIDRNHLDIDKMFIGSNRLNLSEEDLIARPHGFIPADDVNSVKPVEYGDVPRSVEISISHLEEDATVATGINPRQQALPTTGTATEAAILKESTLKRIRLKVRRFEREFLTRQARLRVSNIIQYYSQPKLEKIVGESGTQEYKEQVEQLKAKGLLVTKGSENYKASYRQIRLEGSEFDVDTTGQPKKKSIKGFSFFELEPKFFIPERGGFDIKFEAGSTLPISKPLLQSKATEMFDRLIQLSDMVVPGAPISTQKLTDYLIKVNDQNPADFSSEQETPEDDAATRLQMAIELANTENDLMIRGQDIPGTAYAPSAHTLIHTKFMSSPAFQEVEATDPRVQIFMKHVAFEIAAQQDRQSGQVSAPVPGAPNGAPVVPQNGQKGALQDTLPAKISGGGQVEPSI